MTKVELDPTQARIQTNQDSRPTPDPTVLTTQMVQREIAATREILETRLKCIEEKQADHGVFLEQRHTVISTEINHVKELQEAKDTTVTEKFRSVDVRFQERDTRTDKTAELNQKALDAALLTAEKAVGKQNETFAVATAKSEAAMVKQIDLQSALLQTETNGMKGMIDDLKSRLAIQEGRTNGSDRSEKQNIDHLGIIIGAVVALVAIAALIISIMKATGH